MPAHRTGQNIQCPTCGAVRYRQRAEIKRGVQHCSLMCAYTSNVGNKALIVGSYRGGAANKARFGTQAEQDERQLLRRNRHDRRRWARAYHAKYPDEKLEVLGGF
jgi:hypothetical protein